MANTVSTPKLQHPSNPQQDSRTPIGINNRSIMPVGTQMYLFEYFPEASRQYSIPYVFQVNPTTFTPTMKQRITRKKTRGGHAEEHWGSEYDVLNVQGSTRGFLHIDPNNKNASYGYAANYTGINNNLNDADRGKIREDSFYYQDFMDLLEMYRNNANIYNNKGNIIGRGEIIMSYDDSTYAGFFTQFNYKDSALSPYKFDISFTFKVTYHEIHMYG